MPCRNSENIAGELWAKLILNCAGHAVSALARASCGRSRVAGSTAQDTVQGKRTENITRRGRELGMPTLVNHTLFALVKLLEENQKDA